ncbi:MAG TPA: hypothetical protein VGE07_30000 [Herpetosiphonaceae bacterium]
MGRFIKITCGSYVIHHGYDEQNQEIVEEVAQEPAPKLIALERVLSVTERYVLTAAAHGRVIYWEYVEEFAELERLLAAEGLLLGA